MNSNQILISVCRPISQNFISENDTLNSKHDKINVTATLITRAVLVCIHRMIDGKTETVTTNLKINEK